MKRGWVWIPGLAVGVLALHASSAAPDAGSEAADAGTMVQVDAGPSDAGAELATADDADEASADEAGPAVPSRLLAPPIATARPISPEQDLLAHAVRNGQGKLVVPGVDGGEPRALTIDPDLQSELTRILETYDPPYGAVVAIDPSTGKVLAMAEHSSADPKMRGLCTKAVFPAASIFKIVTASALLEAGVKPDDTECARYARRRLNPNILTDASGTGICRTLSEALAKSANSIFAKLTFKHLTTRALAEQAKAFRFNQPIDFPIPTDVSLAAFPEDRFGLSCAGAGFGDVYLSPLHGAMLAATVANGGLWHSPVLFESERIPAPDRVLPESHARELADMMEETVTDGTARRIFRERGFHVKGAVGKTGSLSDKRPFRDYSWFVGYAPKDKPEVAVGAVVVNSPFWRIKGAWLGREAMRLAIEDATKNASSAAR